MTRERSHFRATAARSNIAFMSAGVSAGARGDVAGFVQDGTPGAHGLELALEVADRSQVRLDLQTNRRCRGASRSPSSSFDEVVEHALAAELERCRSSRGECRAREEAAEELVRDRSPPCSSVLTRARTWGCRHPRSARRGGAPAR